ncbi:beta-glucoside-specific PTS transporter subunit IIABC [Bacillus sp. FJAT-50079]|uniref:beta-glucoside-specific PTS transporter subunit IIABC n=1 Tax=Bacillus sp. FJAT-50079 TaxID=2833577 RepID=UPI001BCA2949|nr:beta-glucoside-specific PTS transporter subunit IIABC [Bacillus sp. FJAT-50079]MBS4210492.1 beta-glucoside-specific PTS transporter subunit IIABC [Bacillus sp. FJAT-50079]
MGNKKLAEAIIKEMGGNGNIHQSWHCITRLRFNVENKDKINIDKIKLLEGVLGAQYKSGQFQVIIGSNVADLYAEVNKLLDEKTVNKGTPKQKLNVVEYVFDVISGIFTPVLPAIVGGGLLKGILALLVTFNLLSDKGSNYEILTFISDAPFHFLPFLLAFSAARKFNTDSSLAIALAGVLMYPQIMTYANSGEVISLKFLGLPIPMNSYASSVIPIILGVLLLSYVYKQLDKIIPKSLRIIFLPVLSLVITAPLTLGLIAPLGRYVGIYLDTFFTGLFSVAGPIAGLLLGGLMPLIVITGMHYAFFPGAFAAFDKYGYDIMLLPMNLVANLAQAGATLGVFIKTKDKKMKQLSISTFIPAVFGITEPTIYGVTMKLKKPFYASLVGGAVGGAIFGFFAVKATAFTVPGIMAIPTYIIKDTNNLLYASIGVASSFLVAMIVTLLLGFKEETAKATEEIVEGKNAKPVIDDNVSNAIKENPNAPIDVSSPLTGKVIPLKEVPDSTFSKELVGKGVAIIPEEGIVYAPFPGKVIMSTPTNHAIGIVSDDGVELLIHVGLETVSLNGKGFKLLVREGEEFHVGDKLLSFDIELLKQEDVSLISPIVVTNIAQYLDVISTNDQQAKACESKLFMLIR